MVVSEVVAYVVSAVGVVIGCISGIVSFLYARSFKKYLHEAKLRGSYTICPHCKEKVLLSQCHWHLADGSIDDDLNGVVDK